MRAHELDDAPPVAPRRQLGARGARARAALAFAGSRNAFCRASHVAARPREPPPAACSGAARRCAARAAALAAGAPGRCARRPPRARARPLARAARWMAPRAPERAPRAPSGSAGGGARGASSARPRPHASPAAECFETEIAVGPPPRLRVRSPRRGATVCRNARREARREQRRRRSAGTTRRSHAAFFAPVHGQIGRKDELWRGRVVAEGPEPPPSRMRSSRRRSLTPCGALGRMVAARRRRGGAFAAAGGGLLLLDTTCQSPPVLPDAGAADASPGALRSLLLRPPRGIGCGEIAIRAKSPRAVVDTRPGIVKPAGKNHPLSEPSALSSLEIRGI